MKTISLNQKYALWSQSLYFKKLLAHVSIDMVSHGQSIDPLFFSYGIFLLRLFQLWSVHSLWVCITCSVSFFYFAPNILWFMCLRISFVRLSPHDCANLNLPAYFSLLFLCLLPFLDWEFSFSLCFLPRVRIMVS